ncbi:MAG: hypothetical protein M9958_00415 [Chitinophagales bacterium]|nr:hypothetical protein [Chitinophagales bacterium]
MNSPFANIYLSIMKRIETEIPEIVHVAQDHGQLEGYVRRPSLAFPCVLIDFQTWTFSNMSDAVQIAEGDVVIKLAFAQVADEDNLTEEYWRKIALEYYEIECKLNQFLHGWSPTDNTGTLTRTHADKENRPALRIRTFRYRLEFEDYGARPVQNTIYFQEN